MGRHTGKNGKVKFGSNFVGALTGFDINVASDTVDLTAAEDEWKENEGTYKSWSGTVSLRLDHADAAQAASNAGDTIAFEGYTEGDTTGRTYFSGNIILTGADVSAPYDADVGRTYRFIGDGALTEAVVA